MMLKSTQQAVAAPRAAAARAAPRPAQRRAPLARAGIPKEDLPESVQETSGFVAYDSAGQSNMYPVYTKAYETTKADANSNATLVAGGVGAAVAIGAIVLAAGLGAAGTGDIDLGDLKSLTDYAAAFAKDL